MSARSRTERLANYRRLRILWEKGVNPFLLASDLAGLIFEAAKESFQGIRTAGIKSPSSVSENISENVAKRLTNMNRTGFLGTYSTVPWDFTDAFGDRLLMDWIRGFMKDCSDYLTSIQSREEFEDDPLVFDMLYRDSSQTLISNVWPNSTSSSIKGVKKYSQLDRAAKEGFEKLRGPCCISTCPDPLVIIDRHFEIWMELMAGINVCLYFLQRTHHPSWNRVLEISLRRTQGLPSGVCAYRGTGDVFRKFSRMVREQDSRVSGGATLLQVSRNSLLLKDDDNNWDFTPKPFRKIGSAYCFFQYFSALYFIKQSGGDATIKLLYSSDNTRPIAPFLSISELRCLFPKQFVAKRIAHHNLEGILSCTLGVDDGVYSLFSGEVANVPYVMRQVSDDFLNSFRSRVEEVWGVRGLQSASRSLVRPDP